MIWRIERADRLEAWATGRSLEQRQALAEWIEQAGRDPHSLTEHRLERQGLRHAAFYGLVPGAGCIIVFSIAPVPVPVVIIIDVVDPPAPGATDHQMQRSCTRLRAYVVAIDQVPSACK